MPRSFIAFAMATLLPLLLAGALFGGWAAWLALIYITLFIAGIDEFVPALTRDGPAGDPEDSDLLSLILAAAHGLLLLVVIWSLSGHGVGLLSLDGAALFAASGLFFGQVSNSNAHELIHRRNRVLHLVGVAIYTSLFFGHYASAHPTVRHTHVGTRKDPNTSRMNESFWRYVRRA